jgi:superfamily II DNA/RNA helicase
MNVDVPKKVLSRKLRKQRRSAPKQQNKDDAEFEEEEQPKEKKPRSSDESQEAEVETPMAMKSSILTNVKFDVLKGRITDRTLTKLDQMGFKFMTEIQSKAIEPLLEVHFQRNF